MKFSPQPFELDWREADTRRWLAAQGKANDTQGAEREQPAQIHNQWLARAVGAHVAWRMRQYTFTHPQGAVGLDTYFTRTLKELEENLGSTPSQIQAGRYFLQAIKRRVGWETDVDRAHGIIVGFVMDGDIPDLGVKETCQATGVEVGYGFRQWRGSAEPSRTPRNLLRP